MMKMVEIWISWYFGIRLCLEQWLKLEFYRQKSINLKRIRKKNMQYGQFYVPLVIVSI